MWSSYYYCDQNPMRRFTKALCSKHATCEALLQLQQPVVFSGFDLEWTKMQQNNLWHYGVPLCIRYPLNYACVLTQRAQGQADKTS